MSKKHNVDGVDLKEESIQRYDEMLNELKSEVERLKAIKKRKKKIRKLEREKKEMLIKIKNKHK
ncbi:hypothetical protein ACFIJ5_15830 [Haloimpatiens sp. FM7330]|uniref:hypothetical protein n=1 Tax=Haloimpatiens sp. FM7330 TaxID=3298610 RepID=UPI0036457FF8